MAEQFRWVKYYFMYPEISRLRRGCLVFFGAIKQQLLGGSSHLVSGLVHPSYGIFVGLIHKKNWGELTHLRAVGSEPQQLWITSWPLWRQVFTGYFLMNLQGDFYQNQAGIADVESTSFFEWISFCIGSLTEIEVFLMVLYGFLGLKLHQRNGI